MTVAVPRQEEIEVFPNEGGGISITMLDDDHVTGQSVVVVRPENVEHLIRALRAAKRMALGKDA